MTSAQKALQFEEKPKIILRNYQQQAVNAALKGWSDGLRSVMMVLPTGAGKTIVFSDLTRLCGSKGKQSMILAHRGELLTQAVEKNHMVWPESRIGLIGGGSFVEGEDVTVASVQSLHPWNLEKLKNEYRLIITDECHHSTAPTYQAIYRHFPNALLLGVTATPGRADGKGLKTFEKTVFQMKITDLIRMGYLVSPQSRQVRMDINLDLIKKTAGDFNLKALGQLFRDHKQHLPVIEAWFSEKKKYDVKKGIAFCVDVAHSEDLAEAFRSAGVKADCIHGGMKKHDRARVLADFHAGRIEILTNCNVLTEGFDEPSVDCLLMVRPTMSQALYIQMVGRGLRLYPGKEFCRVIDFVGLSHHNLVQTGNFLEDNYYASGAGGYKAMRLHWVGIDNNYYLQAKDKYGTTRMFVLELVDRANDIYRAYLKNGRSKQIISEAPLHWAQGQAEEVIRKTINKKDLFFKKADASWRNKPASKKQIQMTERFGLPTPATCGQASDLLDAYFIKRNL